MIRNTLYPLHLNSMLDAIQNFLPGRYLSSSGKPATTCARTAFDFHEISFLSCRNSYRSDIEICRADCRLDSKLVLTF